MRVVDMVNKLDSILKEKDGKQTIVEGKRYLIEGRYIIEDYGYHNKFMPREMTKGQLELFLEFLED